THWPLRNTSGARPSIARGSAISGIGSLDLFRFPRIALVEAKPDVAARARRSAKADLAPGGGVRVIDCRYLFQQQRLEEALDREPAPFVGLDLAELHCLQQRVLLRCREPDKGFAVTLPALRLDRIQPLSPRLPQRRHPLVA